MAGIEGPNLIGEALRAGLRLECVFVAEGAEGLLDDLALPPETDILLMPRALLNSALTTETPQPLAALRAVAAEAGATVNQVVLAWLMGAELPVVPLVGASSVAQLEESLAAVDLELTAEQRGRLDQAH